MNAPEFDSLYGAARRLTARLRADGHSLATVAVDETHNQLFVYVKPGVDMIRSKYKLWEGFNVVVASTVFQPANIKILDYMS
jgi:hypothetical protein